MLFSIWRVLKGLRLISGKTMFFSRQDGQNICGKFHWRLSCRASVPGSISPELAMALANLFR
jgi:hypothetical protein